MMYWIVNLSGFAAAPQQTSEMCCDFISRPPLHEEPDQAEVNYNRIVQWFSNIGNWSVWAYFRNSTRFAA